MATIQEGIIETLSGLRDDHTVYVLKGFNRWVDSINGEFLFGRRPILDSQLDFRAVSSKLSSGRSFFALHEDIAWLGDKKLGGLPQMHGYNLVVIENDAFYIYYPGYDTSSWGYETQELFNRDTDNIVQQYYGDVSVAEGLSYIAYNDLVGVEYTEVLLSSLCSFTANLSDGAVELPEEYDAVAYANIVMDVIDDNIGEINVLVDKVDTDVNIRKLKNFLLPIGVRFTLRDYANIEDEIDEVRAEAYREILRRKNSSYNFRDIKVYSDPYEGAEIDDVNQVRVVDDIVANAIKSQGGEPFRDVFTTAPTGAGKSVMFQVPAIYLAEKHDLLTIVVSPLIGLMNDQVDNIKSMTSAAATINSDYTPIEKENTMDRVKSGEISILYLSPESLLSNSDITNLIGDRKIGLVVVDEAHIVATWGKSFRPDYWYLGEFIHRLRNDPKTEHRFPIATFTATATFGGNENMYQEIIESLKMTPLKYIGNVKRDDISFDVRRHIKDHAYKEEKLQTAADAINAMAQNELEKTLVYVPYTRHISDLYGKMHDQARVGKYAGNMTPGEKNETLKSIKDGSKNVVLATKAFGMGIDIDDIKNVYHFAPTGNVADYVQEIGRAARRPDIRGVASTDFYKEDFRYIKQLHGMSSIKNYQVKAVLQKIFELYTKYNKRNFLVSPDEFSYIFADMRPDEIDAKLKTTLLIIKKDFELDPSLNYVPLIFKPRSMFTYGYFMINDEFIPVLQSHNLLRFFKKLDLPRMTEDLDRTGSIITTRSPGDTYQLDFKSLWENRYRDMSFGMFKRAFYMGELPGFDFRINGENRMLINRVVLEIDGKNKFFGELKRELLGFLDTMKEIFDDLRQAGRHFSSEELSQRIIDKHGVGKKHIADMVASSFMHLLARVDASSMFNAGNFFEYNSATNKFVIKNTSYEKRLYSLKKTVRIMLADDRKTKTVRYSTKLTDDKQVILGQIIELLEAAECKISSGSHPEFFVRVNNPYAIERINSNQSYVSRTVSLVGEKHKESYELMGYFFEKLNTDDERWDFIEKYFLGQLGDVEA